MFGCHSCNSLIYFLPIAIYVGYLFFRKWMQGPKFIVTERIDDKVVVITGGNAGIGKATAIELAKLGATVYIACRDKFRADIAVEDIKTASLNENVKFLKLDLSSFKSIINFVKEFKSQESRLDILINNAAVMPYSRAETEDGLELQMGVNHFGHFLLTNLLLDLLEKSKPSRVINVASLAHLGAELDKDDLMSKKGYTMIGTYRKSKLANVLFTKELSNRLKGTGVSTFSLHPGGMQ